MIRAMIFDLDGTLVKTERLKAISYAQAAIELCPAEITESKALEAFKQVVGLSRKEVAQQLLAQFNLEKTAIQFMQEFGVTTPWQAFLQIRLRHYEKMINDPQVIKDNQWPHTMALLQQARLMHCRIGLATMSSCRQVRNILEVLSLTGVFDFVATINDISHPKPHPEIYFLVRDEFHVRSEECLVIEDSPVGVEAALNAGMHVVAVATPFTQHLLHLSNLLAPALIVDRPEDLIHQVTTLVAEINKNEP